jgi:Domain of unknown function (DUF1707)/Cell wall-active antibiotics response 4TMS YvqF
VDNTTAMDDSSTPALLASDAERDQVVAALRDHLVDGRLTLDDFSQRLDAAHAARTAAELEALTDDLPRSSAPAGVSKRKPIRWSVAVMGGVERRSRWRVPEQTVAVAVMGGCCLDLRKAEIESSEIDVTAVAVMGGVDIIVPEGVEVELTGFALMGGKDARLRDVPPLPGTPFVRVRAFAFMGGVTVHSKPRAQSVQTAPPATSLRPPALGREPVKED